eukprot:gene10062-10217_t
MQHEAPFATAAIAADVYPEAFHLQHRPTGVAGKAGADAFDNSVYSDNLASNIKNMAESKRRNYSGSGVPYATQEVSQHFPAHEKEFHLQETHKTLPDKIGSAAGFDAEAYRMNLTANQQLHEQSKQKKFGSGGEAGCPFAVSDSTESRQQWQRPDYHAKAQAKPMADKVGSESDFDTAVYSNNLMRNRQLQADNTQRNFVGSGKILAFAPSSSH